MRVIPEQITCRSLIIASAIFYLVSCGAPATPSAPPVSSKPVFTPSPSRTLPPRPTLQEITPTYKSPTLIPYLSLTVEEREKWVKKMLQNNGGCELPCWWGIMPGQTTIQAMKEIFASEGIPWDRESDLGIDPPLAHRYQSYNIHLSVVHQQTELVQELAISVQVFGEPDSNYFAHDWSRYSLDQVLTRHGMPTQVTLYMQGGAEPGAGGEYALQVVYDNLGFLIVYGGESIVKTPNLLKACPIFDQIGTLFLKLQSPETGKPVLQLEPNVADAIALEKVTGMDLETFYETFREPASKTCLEGTPTPM
jgi:hypothetical protein